MNQQEIINAMALTRVSPYESEAINTLYRKVGTATDVLALGKNVRDVLPSASNRLVDAMGDVSEVLRRAEQEFCCNRKARHQGAYAGLRRLSAATQPVQ